jgi:hypothetical protein
LAWQAKDDGVLPYKAFLIGELKMIILILNMFSRGACYGLRAHPTTPSGKFTCMG